jgi:hypothetical protein
MSTETPHTTVESNPVLMSTTRRTALRGAGLVGILALGVGNTGASQAVPSINTYQALNEPSDTAEPVPVTWENYRRAESDTYFQRYVELGGFGTFYHIRELVPIDQQNVIQMNRDTLYSAGVFDLTEPVTVTKPDTGDRYQLMIVINQDHYVNVSSTDSGEFTLTQDEIGTRYCMVVFRTFFDPTDSDDVEAARSIQDEITASQQSSGTFEIPNWDQESLERIRNALIVVGETMNDTRDTYGTVDAVNPIKHLLGTAIAWGGMPETDCFSGERPSRTTVKHHTPSPSTMFPSTGSGRSPSTTAIGISSRTSTTHIQSTT